MKFQQLLKLVLLTVSIGMFSVQAQANSCGDPSPLMATLGDKYANLAYSPEDFTGKTSLDQDDLRALIKKSKLHSGRGTRVDCLGTKGWGEEITSTYSLIHMDLRENTKGSLMLRAVTKNVKVTPSSTGIIKKGKYHEVIELPKAETWQGNSSNGYSTSFLFRLKNASNFGSRPAELALTLQDNGNGITVTETLYINGRKFVWTTWELDS